MNSRAIHRLLFLLAVVAYSFGDSQYIKNASTHQASELGSPSAADIRVDNLPVLSISTPYVIADEPKVACTVQMFAPKGSARWNTEPLAARIEVRGGVSRMHPKQSYAFELAGPVQLLDMRTDDDWILNAAYVDISLMRHKLAFDLFRSLGTSEGSAGKRFAVDSRFIEVYLNGNYRGVYLLMERVDAKLLGFTPWNREAQHHACAYKAVNHSANFYELGHQGYRQKEPNPKHQTYWQPIDDFNAFVVNANRSEFFHPRTGVGSRLNLSNAIDFHLLVLVTSNYDGNTKNFYFCRDGSHSDSLTARFFFVPWDYDGSFGRNWDGRKMSYGDWMANHLLNRLHSDKTYRRNFQLRWKSVYQKQFSARNIHRQIDKSVQTLGDAVVRNFERWPTHQHHHPLSFTDEVAYIKSWVEKRLRWLDQEINELK